MTIDASVRFLNPPMTQRPIGDTKSSSTILVLQEMGSMASLATHFSAFIFLFPVGLRRLVCSSSLYLTNPSLYRSKGWFLSQPGWKNLDFYILLIFLPISSFSEFFFFFTFSGHPTYRFSFFQQSFALFVFWVLIILIGFKESYDTPLINEGFVFLFAGISFLFEYSLIGKGITGLGGGVYDFLGGLTLVCACSCFYLSIKPAAFFADFCLSLGLILKGTWLLQAGCSLYTDSFALKGCERIALPLVDENADVHCALDEDRLRGIALMNFLFTLHAIIVLILSIGTFMLCSYKRNLRCVEVRGPLLAELESHHVPMRTPPELEMD